MLWYGRLVGGLCDGTVFAGNVMPVLPGLRSHVWVYIVESGNQNGTNRDVHHVCVYVYIHTHIYIQDSGNRSS